MSITINDPVLLAQLRAATGSIELRGPNGDYLGAFRTSFAKPPAGYVPPITDEELAERRTETTGRPLADILKDLRARG
jgi:hypothetical protein